MLFEILINVISSNLHYVTLTFSSKTFLVKFSSKNCKENPLIKLEVQNIKQQLPIVLIKNNISSIRELEGDHNNRKLIFQIL